MTYVHRLLNFQHDRISANLSSYLGRCEGLSKFYAVPLLPLRPSLIPLDRGHSQQAAADACVDDGGNFASSSICSMFHPPPSHSPRNIEGIPTSCGKYLRRHPTKTVEFGNLLTFFAGFSVADLNVAPRSHTISDVRNGAIPFLPFLERGGKGGGERRDRARGRVPSTIWGGGFKNRYPSSFVAL